MESGEDLNKARLGEYRDSEGNEIQIIRTAVATYEKVYVESGEVFPLGTTVQESDIKGLEKISS